MVQRAANVLSLLFVHGGMLASELSTVINTSHTSLHGNFNSVLCFTWNCLMILI